MFDYTIRNLKLLIWELKNELHQEGNIPEVEQAISILEKAGEK